MALDNAQFISELSITDPPGTDPLSEGDDQIRTSKRTQLQSFPNIDAAVTFTAAQLNAAAITTQSNTFSATQTFTNATEFIRSDDLSIVQLRYRTETNVDRWDLLMRPAASNDNFVLQRRGPTGTFIDFPWQVDATTGQFEVPDGTAVLPQYSFISEPGTGMYRPGTSIGWAIAGVNAAFLLPAQFRMELSGSVAAPAYSFQPNTNMGMYRGGANLLGLATGGLEALLIDSGQQIKLRKENTVTRLVNTQARTGWRYTNDANLPMWAIYLGADPNNTLAFQRYNNAGAFQDIPFSIRQLNGLIRMSTLPTSSAGLISGELWRNPVSPGFVAIV